MSSTRFPLPVLGDVPSPSEPERPDEAGFAKGRVPGEHGYGRTYWRSMEERLHGDAAIPDKDREFAKGAFDAPPGFARRDFLQLMGASLALAGVTACTEKPVERVLAYTKTPDGLTPGNPLHFATAASFGGGYGLGLLVTSWEGRPVKVEGNPSHPTSSGTTGPHAQAMLLTMYDPNRARVLKERGAGRSWRSFRESMRQRATAWSANAGAGLRFLVEPSASPLHGQLRASILKRFPAARFHGYSAVSQDNAHEGARLAFGAPLEVHRNLDRADVILSLDADFLEATAENLAENRGFAGRRDPKHPSGLNRLYVVEPRLSITGTMADHRLAVRSSEIEGIALSLAAQLGRTVPPLARFTDGRAATPSADRAKWITAVAKDLARRPGRSVVAAGERQSALTHAVVHAINAGLGNVGSTVRYTEPLVEDTATGHAGWGPLVEDLRAGKVDTLVITAWNPVYSAPADVELAALLRSVPNVVYLGLYDDETSLAANWFLPAAHPFESWGDVRSRTGVTSIVQPLINPLFGGFSEVELFGTFLDVPERKPYDLLRDLHRGRGKLGDFETAWETWLSTGVVPGTEVAFVTPALRTSEILTASSAARPASAEGIELNFVRDYKLGDGRWARNSWLQEIPDPITKIAWDNAALLSPATAARLSVKDGDLVTLKLSGRSVDAPVAVQPGCADETVTVALGYGGMRILELGVEEAVGELVQIGFNAGRLRTSAAPWFSTGLEVGKTGKGYLLARTQTQATADGRPVALMQTAEEFEKEPEAKEYRRPTRTAKGQTVPGNPLASVQKPVDYSQQQYKWAMSVDMGRCTGCTACVVACQAENNIPVVGKDQVHRGRVMHWIRIDRYYTGELANPEVVHEPMMCQHCENAPCEYVCPVNATVHSDEGLNDMVYNRCIGTRYCSNNCPYKVRRFNYLHWTQDKSQAEQMLMNPDVTVRARGVMEKCTYCVQRIERTRITSRLENRAIREGELKTACQAVCPTGAIVFGSLHDPASAVSRLHADERRFDVLYELNTRPRTAYLTKLKNPNPELA